MSVIRQMLRDLQRYHDRNTVVTAPPLPHPCRPGMLFQMLRTVPLTTGLALLGMAGIALLWGVGGWLTGVVSVVKGSPPPPVVTRAPQQRQTPQTPVAPARPERPAAPILAQPPATAKQTAAPRPAVTTPPALAAVLPAEQNAPLETAVALAVPPDVESALPPIATVTVLPEGQVAVAEPPVALTVVQEVEPVVAPLVPAAIPEPEVVSVAFSVAAVPAEVVPPVAVPEVPVIALEPAIVAPAAVAFSVPDEVVPPIVGPEVATVMLEATAAKPAAEGALSVPDEAPAPVAMIEPTGVVHDPVGTEAPAVGALPVPTETATMTVAPVIPAPVVLPVETAPLQSPAALVAVLPEEQVPALKLPATETAAPASLNYFKEAERAYQEGLAAYQTNRTEASLVALHLAIGFYPGHLVARELLADQLELRGEGPAALALLEEGLAIVPDYTAFRKRAARLLLDRGEVDAAAKTLIGPGLVPAQADPELHWLLANTYQQLGEHLLAAQTYRNLLAHDPRNGPLWFNLGSALEASGQTDAAFQAYQQGLKFGGLDQKMTAWAKEFTAAALPAAVATPPAPALNYFKEAERAYQEGLAAYQTNRIEASLVALRLALGFYPGHLLARELLADQLELKGEDAEVLGLLREGLVIAPDHAAFRKRAARLLLDRGEVAAAAQMLIGPGLVPVQADPELHRLLAQTYQQLGESFLAVQTYRNLLIRDPRNGTLWVTLGATLETDGQRDEARKAYQRALTVGGLSREEYAQARAGLETP